MADNGYTRKVLGYVGNLPNGTLVTVDHIREHVLPDVPNTATAPSVMSVLARAEEPVIERVRNGAYRVIRGRRGSGRPPGSRTQYADGAAPEPETPPAQGARRATRRASAPAPAAAPVSDRADVLFLTLLRGLPDGRGLYLDDGSGIYKVERIG